MIREFNPANTIITYFDFNLSGFADGTFVEAQRVEDNSTEVAGADGRIGIAVNANKSGTISLTLQQNSESNWFLSAIQATQDARGVLARGSFIVTEPSGGFLMIAKNVHIKTPAPMGLAKELTPKTWVLFAENIQYGSLPSELAQAAGIAARVQSAVDSAFKNIL